MILNESRGDANLVLQTDRPVPWAHNCSYFSISSQISGKIAKFAGVSQLQIDPGLGTGPDKTQGLASQASSV